MRGDAASSHARSYKWTILGLFWLIYFMNQADRQVLFSVFPLIQKELGLSDTALGLLGSAFFWVFAILVPVAGTLGDRLSRKKIIIAALLLWSAATMTSGLASGFILLLVFRGLTGGGEAFYYPAAASMISDYHGQKSRALAMGIHQTAVYLGIIGSGTLAGFIGQIYGWRAAFISFGVAGIVLAAVAVAVLREPVRGMADAAAPAIAAAVPALRTRISATLATPTFWLLMAAFMCMKLVDAAYLAWMPTLLYRKFEMSLATAGFHATFWHHAGAMLGVLIGGRWSDRMALRNVMTRPLVQVAGLLLGAPFIFLLGVTSGQGIMFAAMALFGFCRGLYDSNLFVSLFEVVPPPHRATATGMMLASAFLVGGFAPLLTGAATRTLPLGDALAYSSGIYVIGGLFIVLNCATCFRADAMRLRTSPATGEPR